MTKSSATKRPLPCVPVALAVELGTDGLAAVAYELVHKATLLWSMRTTLHLVRHNLRITSRALPSPHFLCLDLRLPPLQYDLLFPLPFLLKPIILPLIPSHPPPLIALTSPLIIPRSSLANSLMSLGPSTEEPA